MRPLSSAVEGRAPHAAKQDRIAEREAVADFGDFALLCDFAQLSSQSLIDVSSKEIGDLERGGSTFGLFGRVPTVRSAGLVSALVLLAVRAEGGRRELDVRQRLFDRWA